MPAEHNIDNESKLILTTWHGVAVDSEFIAALNKYIEEIKSVPEYADYNEIVDLSKASEMNLTINGLLTMGRIASAADNISTNKKMALIVGSTFSQGLANLYIFYRNLGDKNRKKIRVFKKEDEAFKWVNSDS